MIKYLYTIYEYIICIQGKIKIISHTIVYLIANVQIFFLIIIIFYLDKQTGIYNIRPEVFTFTKNCTVFLCVHYQIRRFI